MPGKALAHGLGADYLEQDIVASRDGALLVLHDLWLDDVSDVTEHFPRRCRDDGHFYCVDFDLAEIQKLRFGERLDLTTGIEKYPHRFSRAAGGFRVVTLDEEIRFIQGLNASTGRTVGIYPEVKEPRWHLEQGIDLTSLVVDTLDRHGYLEEGSGAYLQCLDAQALREVRRRAGTTLQIIQLLGSSTVVDATSLRTVAEYANGIGPSIKLIWRESREGEGYHLSDLVSVAHDLGLVVHPYTFRIDDLPVNCANFDELLRVFITKLGVDGLFTDFTDQVARFIRA